MTTRIFTKRLPLLALFALACAALAPTPGHAQDAQLLPNSAARPGFVGVELQELQEDAPIVVGNVVPGSPAETAGVRPGDLLVAWNGNRDVLSVLMQLSVAEGETIRLTVRRGGEEHELTVVAGPRPS